jgi:hypothetical protein
MKKTILFALICILAVSGINAQKWADLSTEQKLSKVAGFREDNQKYLKNTLKMSPTQLDDIDNVNICFISSLDRIDRYGKDATAKEQYAKAALAARSVQLDAIMGVANREKFYDYVTAKIKKAMAK